MCLLTGANGAAECDTEGFQSIRGPVAPRAYAAAARASTSDLAKSALSLPLCFLASTSANFGFGGGNGICLPAAIISHVEAVSGAIQSTWINDADNSFLSRGGDRSSHRRGRDPSLQSPIIFRGRNLYLLRKPYVPHTRGPAT
jgi:hypothetical protein